MHAAVHARSTTAPCLLLLAKVGLLSRTWCPNHLWLKNPVQILAPTRPRCTTSEGPWLNPDLTGKWSHSPGKALTFLPEAQTNTILILNPSSNPLYSSSLNFPNIFTCAKRRQTNLKCPPFSGWYFMTHSLTTHFFFCVWVCTLNQNCLHKKKGTSPPVC